MTLALYGHPFSSYTWKALIALYANDTEFDFRMVDGDHPDHAELVQSASPQGKFPVLQHGDNLVFETSPIIEYLDAHFPGDHRFVPSDTDAAIVVRMLDRVFDHYVMNVMQVVVDEHIRSGADADPVRCEEARVRLRRTYDWLENWLAYYPERASRSPWSNAPPHPRCSTPTGSNRSATSGHGSRTGAGTC
jgi:glutathione S-transferase